MTEEEKAQIELEVRRNISNEIQSYREFLEKQFRLIIWSAALGVPLAVLILLHFFSDYKEELRNDLKREVSHSMIEYEIDQKLQEKLKALAVHVAEGQLVKDAINKGVLDEVNKTAPPEIARLVKESSSKEIAKAVQEEFKKIQGQDFQQLIRAAAQSEIKQLSGQMETKLAETNNRLAILDNSAVKFNSHIRLQVKNSDKIIGTHGSDDKLGTPVDVGIRDGNENYFTVIKRN